MPPITHQTHHSAVGNSDTLILSSASYLTSTQVKLILVTDTARLGTGTNGNLSPGGGGNVAQTKEGEGAHVKKVFQLLHGAYIDAVSNPFYTPGKKIDSKLFSNKVDEIVSQA